MKKALVFGGGVSGKAAAELLRREGAEVTLLDGDVPFPADEYELAVTSPGIALDHPWQRAARERRIPVVSELQLGAERWRAHGGRMLAVTGSKGKSSVVKLVADTLTLAGRPAVPCGNYGTPLCAICNSYLPSSPIPSPSPSSSLSSSIPYSLSPIHSLPWAVVEVSSFQLETTELPDDAFEAAALLNLQEDHLDRHGSREVYHALKLRLLAMTRHPIDVSEVSASPEDAHALFAGSYFDNPILSANGFAAVKLLRAAGLDDAALAAGFAAFVPLPHRMQEVCVRDGVRFIDDSKATSIAALCAGITMATAKNAGFDGHGNELSIDRRQSKCLLIAGGLAKGDDPKIAFTPLQCGVKKVYLIGSCAQQLQEAWSGVVPCEMCGTLENAVAAARRDAVSGDAVLLSPGTASFDQFQSYNERGAAFAALAEKE